MSIYNHIGILVLAGGKSSRMGQDKGLMNYKGEPLIQFVLNTAKKISPHILIVANLDAYNQFGFKVVKDLVVEKGPMGGLYSGLIGSGFDYNLVLSCDVPNVHQGVLEYLIESCTGKDITVSEQNGKLHPLIGVYRKTCLPVIEKRLKEENLKMTSLFEDLQVRKLDMADFLPENFMNINTVADL